MREDLEALSWPASHLNEALEALARFSGFAPRASETQPPLSEHFYDAQLLHWIEQAATGLGLEAEAVDCTYPEVDELVQTAAPALVRLEAQPEPRFLLLLRNHKSTVSVLPPSLAVRRIPIPWVRDALCEELEQSAGDMQSALQGLEIASDRHERVRGALLRSLLKFARIEGACWLLRMPPSISLWRHVFRSGIASRVVALLAAHGVGYALGLFAWWLIGQAALQGRLDRGWLLAWALVLVTVLPFQLLTTWLQTSVSIGLGKLLKQRLLFGTLQLDPDEIRHEGGGQLLGKVFESEAVESLALSGGFASLTACVELVMAGVVLTQGAGGRVLVPLLIAWSALTLWLGKSLFYKRQHWTDIRVRMTNDLVERMVGYRTRLIQQVREHWHDGEDQSTELYLDASHQLDNTTRFFLISARAWLVLALCALGSVFVRGSSSLLLALSVGGVLLASQALSKVSTGLSALAGAAIAWRQVAPIFHAASRAQSSRAGVFTPKYSKTPDPSDPSPLLEAIDVVYRYPGHGRPALRGCKLQLKLGDRVLLEGPSGGGKSTLGSVLAGLRPPESGLLLLRGFDRQTLGLDGWRQQVTTAPQFHENHIFCGTLAFNLLMGKNWPPSLYDLQEAETICRELQLGPLLDTMPAGIHQMVGDMGWQLSHGEKSRVYIARTLLQKTDLLIFDESFAALDPQTLTQALQCVLKRAPTVVVIAHP